MYQTLKPDQIAVLVSGTAVPALADLREDFPGVTFHVREDLDDWGHAKRAEGLFIATGDFLGFFNDDDSYTMDYIERMMGAVLEGYDVAYCAWNRIPQCEFKTHSSTSGNYIVRTGLARAVGYPTERDTSGRLRYDSDGGFITMLNDAGALVAPKIEDILYFHNEQ